MSDLVIPCLERDWRAAARWFSEDLDGDVRERVEALEAALGDGLTDLFRAPSVWRLRHFHQNGTNPLSAKCALKQPLIPWHQAPKGHTRFCHVNHVAALNLVACAALGWTGKRAAATVAGGALHDVGHDPFCHTIEFVMERLHFPPHEARGVHALKADLVLQEALFRLGLTLDDILPIIDERGSEGAVQKITDTTAYVVVDPLVCGYFGHRREAEYRATSTHLLQALADVREGVLIFRNLEPLRSMLELRGKLYRDVYEGGLQDFIAECFTLLMRDAHQKGWLDLRQVRRYREAWIVQSLSDMVEAAQGTYRQWAEDLFEAFHATEPLNHGRWERHRLLPLEAEARVWTLPAPLQPLVVHVPHRDGQRLMKRVHAARVGAPPEVVAPRWAVVSRHADNLEHDQLAIPNFIP